MWKKLILVSGLISMFVLAYACTIPVDPENENSSRNENVSEGGDHFPEGGNIGGGVDDFKLPVPPGYDWEITQSWKDHCHYCSDKYHDWNYCYGEDMSHLGSCCTYSWDFNLNGNGDRGKPIVASGDGYVEDVGYSNGWGYFVVLNHGNNLCTRYGHMIRDTQSHLNKGDFVCQGLKLGEIGTSGFSTGEHLHFHFEECDTEETIPRGFTDGNGIPKCVRGKDRYDENGNYTALRLTNRLSTSCRGDTFPFGGGTLPEGGWLKSDCGSLSGCPLINSCSRQYGHKFEDLHLLTQREAKAASYLWSECALDGKEDGGVHPSDYLTRAEALKIPMYLFGIMDKCDGSELERFLDVQSRDWFQPVVACALKHKVISNDSIEFRPHDSVSFVEAAKMVVETAANAGVIELFVEPTNNFPLVPLTHWGRKYLETIYAYGGFDVEVGKLKPDELIKRGDYIVMTASLSPCFCGNISCTGDCECDQSLLACVDKNSADPGIGGHEENFVWDVDFNCYIDLEDNRCDAGENVLYIQCSLGNTTNQIIKVKNMVLGLNSSEDLGACRVSDSNLRSGVSTQNIEPGESRELTGHFEVICEEVPSDRNLEIVLDLFVDESGQPTWYNNFSNQNISMSEEDLICEDCLDYTVCPNNSENTWNCDPNKGYDLHLMSPGGSFEFISGGGMYSFQSEFSSGSELDVKRININCQDLPAVVLLRGGPEIDSAWKDNDSIPDFELWYNYQGQITLEPQETVNSVRNSFQYVNSGVNYLIRIPR